MRNPRLIEVFAVFAALGFSLPEARSVDTEPCLTELRGSAFAKVLRFDGGVIHVDQKSPRFVKARAIGTQKYLVEYRSNDKPSAPVFTGVLTLTHQGKLVGFVVENPSGQTVRDCGPKEETNATPTPSPKPSPSPAPSPSPTPSPTQAPTPIPVAVPPPVEPKRVQKPAAPITEPEPVRIEIETENGD